MLLKFFDGDLAGPDRTGPDREHAEVSMLALHLLQSALVHVNTLLLQRVLDDPGWAARPRSMTSAASLRWSNINPSGRFSLDMDRRLDLEVAANGGDVAAASLS